MGAPLDGRTAVVTGAGRGIGRAVALALAGLGAAVVVNDIGTGSDGIGIDSGPAEAVAREIEAAGGRAMASTASVTDFAAVEGMMADAVARFGGIDILVNNAGLTVASPDLGDGSRDLPARLREPRDRYVQLHPLRRSPHARPRRGPDRQPGLARRPGRRGRRGGVRRREGRRVRAQQRRGA